MHETIFSTSLLLSSCLIRSERKKKGWAGVPSTEGLSRIASMYRNFATSRGLNQLFSVLRQIQCWLLSADFPAIEHGGTVVEISLCYHEIRRMVRASQVVEKKTAQKPWKHASRHIFFKPDGIYDLFGFPSRELQEIPFLHPRRHLLVAPAITFYAIFKRKRQWIKPVHDSYWIWNISDRINTTYEPSDEFR